MYRDDLEKIYVEFVVKGIYLDFNVNDKIVVLVDDVLYIGRIVRVLLDVIIDIGRFKLI